jgi:gliding motility-associated-like protein
MKKTAKKSINLLFITFLLLTNQTIWAQLTNCAVNAGVSANWCFGQNIQLKGNIAGEIVPNTIQWTQVSGPSILINNANTLNALINKPPSGTYVFKLTAQCSQGIAEQTVTHLVYPEVNTNAGPDITLNCYDFSAIPLVGFAPAPKGYYLEWKLDLRVGDVDNDKLFPRASLFWAACEKGKKDTSITLELAYTNPQTGCTYSDFKKVFFQDFAIPPKVISKPICPKELSAFKAVASCNSEPGTWSFISPINGGGASFVSPNSNVSEYQNLKPNTTYIIQWMTSNCAGKVTVLDTFTTILAKAVVPFDPEKDERYFCDPPDSIVLVPPFAADPKKGEKGYWKFVDISEYSNLPQYAVDAYSAVKVLPPFTYDSVRVPVRGFRPGFAYEFRYTIDNGSCPSTFSQFIIVLGHKPTVTEYLSNNCGQGFVNQCVKPNRLCFNKPSVELFIQGYAERFYYRAPPLLISAPAGIDAKKIDLMDGPTSFNTRRDIPNGNYVIQIIPDTSNTEEQCLEPYFFNINFSDVPSKANAGTDVNVCTTTAELPGNAVTTPNWFLLDKLPSSAAIPVEQGGDTYNLKLSGLSPNATYRYIYRSWGGTNCESFYDTVSVRTSNLLPPKPDVGANKTVCGGGKILLEASPLVLPNGTIGQWQLLSQIPVGKPPKIESPNTTSTNVSNIVPNTVYTFRFSAQNGCGIESDSIVVTTDANIGPVQPNAGNDQCLPFGITQAVLIADIPAPVGATGEWTALTTNPNPTTFTTPLNRSTKVEGLQDGKTYQFVFTVKNGICGILSDTMKVSIGSKTKATISDSLLILCNVKLPTSVSLNANTIVGEWSQIDGVPGTIFSSFTNSSITVSNLQAGAYRFRWKAMASVCGGDYDDVFVQIGGPTPIINLGKDTTLCANSDGLIQLNAPSGNGLLGYWIFDEIAPNIPSAGGYFVNKTSSTTPNAVIQLKPGKTRLRWTLFPPPPCNGQATSDDIVVDYIPSSKISDDTLTFCEGSLIELKANSAGNGVGEWSQLSGTPIIGLPKQQNGDNPILIKLKEAGVYKFQFTITSAICPTTQDEVIVRNIKYPIYPNIGLEDTLCVRDAIELKANVLPNGYAATWTLLSIPNNAPNPTFSPNENSQNVRVTNLRTGKYVFKYTITDGFCPLSDIREDSIRLNNINAGNDLMICRDTFVQLGIPNNGLKWQAAVGNPALTTINASLGKISGFTKAGSYDFYLIDTLGCFDDIKITKQSSNVFTSIPNDITVCVGNKVTLEINVDAQNQPFTLQWQNSKDNGISWQSIPNASNTVFTTNSFLSNNSVEKFRVIMSDPICGSDTSKIFSVSAKTIFEVKPNHEACNIDDGNGNNFVDFSKFVLQGDPNIIWQSIDNVEPPGAWTKKNFVGWESNKTYRFVATTTNAQSPCINVTDTLFLLIKPCCPKVCLDSTSILSCNGLNKSIDLNKFLCANSAAGTWSIITAPTSSLPTIANDKFNPFGLPIGVYTFNYSLFPLAPSNCTNGVELKIDVKKSPSAGTVLGNEVKICQNKDTVFTFNQFLLGADTAGIWSSFNMSISPKGSINPQNLPKGKYTAIYTVKGVAGCEDSKVDVTLEILKLPEANAGTNQKITCKIREVEIKGTVEPNSLYTWRNPQGVVLPTQLLHRVTATGAYYLSVVDVLTKCTNQDTVQVIVTEPFITDITAKAIPPPCEGIEVGSITPPNIKGGTPPFQFYLNGDAISKSNNIKNLAPGNYTLSVEDKNGCTLEKQFIIEKREDWKVDLLRDTLLDWGEDTRLEAIVSITNNKINNIQWLKEGFVFDTAFVLSQLVKPLKTTTYEILVFDKKGCQRTAKVVVKVQFDPKIYAPNVFTPNEDGINDRFKLFGNKYIKAVHRLDIFDRWGEWIYNQGLMDLNDPLFGWDGSFRGEIMNNAVFVWVAEVEYLNGERVTLKGDILLLR